MKIDTDDPGALRAHLDEVVYYCTLGIKRLRRSSGVGAQARVSELMLLRKAASAFRVFPPSREEVQQIEDVADHLVGSERAEDTDMQARFAALMEEEVASPMSFTFTKPDQAEQAEPDHEPGSFAEAMARYDEECVDALVEFCRLLSVAPDEPRGVGEASRAVESQRPDRC